MPDHVQEFPFDEIKTPEGDYFASWQAAKDAGFDDNQIWSVTEAEGTYSYGPPHHYVNHVGHVATNERHDMETYYHEEPDPDEFDDEDDEESDLD
jgi:hypothetical protein